MKRAEALEALAVILGACALAVLMVLLTSCASMQVGPFVDPHPKACKADPDCPEHSACRYPSASWPGPVCMSGRESDVYGWSPTASE